MADFGAQYTLRLQSKCSVYCEITKQNSGHPENTEVVLRTGKVSSISLRQSQPVALSWRGTSDFTYTHTNWQLLRNLFFSHFFHHFEQYLDEFVEQIVSLLQLENKR